MQKFRIRHTPTDEESPCPGLRCCDRVGCTAAGEFRAPKSRTRLNDYFWFCLDHVRQYNKDWDYYAGMSEQEIEAQLRQDVTWQRPSWPIGGWRAAEHQMRHRATNDFYGGSAGTGRGEGMGADAGAGRPQGQPRSAEAEALDLLDLPCDADVVQIKARYRELVKLHHPDANGGDRDAEERLKRINQAYTTLKASFGI